MCPNCHSSNTQKTDTIRHHCLDCDYRWIKPPYPHRRASRSPKPPRQP